MMGSFLFKCIGLRSAISAASISGDSSKEAKWNLRKFDNLITFGDSFVPFNFQETLYYTNMSSNYTDKGLLSYFWIHGGNPASVGTVLPFPPVNSDGGII